MLKQLVSKREFSQSDTDALVRFASIRAFVLIYSAAILVTNTDDKATTELFKLEAIQIIADLMRKSLAVDTRQIDERIDWPIILAIFKLLYVICFNEGACRLVGESSIIDTSLQIVESAL